MFFEFLYRLLFGFLLSLLCE
ncbi:exodeoxyribonuclease V, gamma subunit, partial [Chlamydia psittaci 09DC79]